MISKFQIEHSEQKYNVKYFDNKTTFPDTHIKKSSTIAKSTHQKLSFEQGFRPQRATRKQKIRLDSHTAQYVFNQRHLRACIFISIYIYICLVTCLIIC